MIDKFKKALARFFMWFYRGHDGYWYTHAPKKVVRFVTDQLMGGAEDGGGDVAPQNFGALAEIINAVNQEDSSER